MTAPAPLRFVTAGESHGRGLVVVIDGVPAGLAWDGDAVDADLARRQKGYGRGKRQRIEQDRAEVLGGLYPPPESSAAAGEAPTTTGAPLALWVRNRDWDNVKDAWPDPVTVPRPGHADLAGCFKFGTTNIRRTWERSSARGTAATVAAGAVGKLLLRELLGVRLVSHVVRIGDVAIDEEAVAALSPEEIDAAVEASPVRCADPVAAERMIALIDAHKKAGDTLGGELEVAAHGVPVGLGGYVQHDRRLDARIGGALLAVPSAKGVEIGDARRCSLDSGSAVHDAILPGEAGGPPRRGSNRAGGLEGGISTGEPVWARVLFKPIATVPKGIETVDLATGEATRSVYLRSDTCVVPAAGVICEAVLAWELAVALRERCAGDTIAIMRAAIAGGDQVIGGGASGPSDDVEGGER